MARKPFGWCAHHQMIVNPERYHNKCKHARKGAQCKDFSFRLPDWKRDEVRGRDDNHSDKRRP